MGYVPKEGVVEGEVVPPTPSPAVIVSAGRGLVRVVETAMALIWDINFIKVSMQKSDIAVRQT